MQTTPGMTVTSSAWWFAPMGNEVDCVVFVEREDDVMRVISLRKATKQRPLAHR